MINLLKKFEQTASVKVMRHRVYDRFALSQGNITASLASRNSKMLTVVKIKRSIRHNIIKNNFHLKA